MQIMAPQNLFAAAAVTAAAALANKAAWKGELPVKGGQKEVNVTSNDSL